MDTVLAVAVRIVGGVLLSLAVLLAVAVAFVIPALAILAVMLNDTVLQRKQNPKS